MTNDTAPHTYAELARCFSYNPETGVITRIQHADPVRPGRTAALGPLPRSQTSFAFEGRRYYTQRLAWLLATGSWPTDGHFVLPRNGDIRDLRISNLYTADRSQHQTKYQLP